MITYKIVNNIHGGEHQTATAKNIPLYSDGDTL
jgi:hypothetical protein